ncbi:MAG: DUF349 domain-containing protein [Candidatus Cyclobacteriaceae bacterium M3_2C_046]
MKDHKFGYFKGDKLFLKGYLDYQDRVIGEVRESEEQTMAYFENRFQLAVNKVETLEREIAEAENKGSYLMKLLHMRKYLSEFDAIGDFIPLFETLDKLEAQLKEIISINRVKNLEIKQALLEEAKQVMDNPNLNELQEQINEIKQKWIRTGSVSEENQFVEEGFKGILDEVAAKKKAFYERRNAAIQRKVDQYLKILEEAEALKNINPYQASQQIKKLQFQWKKLGMIPRPQKKELDYKFKGISYEIFNNLKKTQRPFRRVDMERNLIEREEIVKKVLSLRERYDERAVAEIKNLQYKWSKSGRVPQEKFHELSEKFFSSCDYVLEHNFIQNLARKKNQDFDKLSDIDQLKLKAKYLQDLISRDEKDVDVYEENSEKFNTGRSFNKLINTKIDSKKRKLKVKKQLLTHLTIIIKNSN